MDIGLRHWSETLVGGHQSWFRQEKWPWPGSVINGCWCASKWCWSGALNTRVPLHHQHIHQGPTEEPLHNMSVVEWYPHVADVFLHGEVHAILTLSMMVKRCSPEVCRYIFSFLQAHTTGTTDMAVVLFGRGQYMLWQWVRWYGGCWWISSKHRPKARIRFLLSHLLLPVLSWFSYRHVGFDLKWLWSW